MRCFKVLACFAVCAALLAAAAPGTAIWPDQVGDFKKVSTRDVTVEDKPLWDEYGLQHAEEAEYAAGTRHGTATIWRFTDPTGAFGAFQWQQPANGRACRLVPECLEAGSATLLVWGNYMLRFEGWKPKSEELEVMLPRLPKLDQSPFPPTYLPAANRVSGTERFINGPTGLAQFEPGIPPSVAGFSQGAEGEIAQFRTGSGDMKLAVFSYPTPQIAIQRLNEFQKLPGAMSKRAGSLIGVVVHPQNSDAAERLLSTVKWNVVITEDERIPTRKDNIGDLIWNIFILIGFILVLFIGAGVVVGIMRRLGVGTSGEAMTVLHLEDRSVSPQPGHGSPERG